MSSIILKYHLPNTHNAEVTIDIPRNHKILHVGLQNQVESKLWVECQIEDSTVSRTIKCVWTGVIDFLDSSFFAEWTYIGTTVTDKVVNHYYIK